VKGRKAVPPIAPPSDFRAAAPVRTRVNQLGPLAELSGTWKGHGFNVIARPDHQQNNDIFLELNPTDEELNFTAIGGAIPNRGSAQDDIQIFGVHYLQQVSDHATGGAIHIEPGIWLNVPATTAPAQPATVVRMASIPHGTAILGQGPQIPLVHGGPAIEFASTVPFPVGGATPAQGTANPFPEYDLSQPSPFRTDPVPADVTQAMVTNPNSLLQAGIATQDIVETIVLSVSSVPPAGVTTFGPGAEDIPFLGPNASVGEFSAVFWIETVQYGDWQYLQLQYTQTVLLNFLGLSWPHVSVATLLKVT
jgi:hypothetical protein